MKTLIKCEYQFDENKYWIDSQSNGIVNSNNINDIKNHIEENDYIEFTKIKPEPIYIDLEGGEVKQIGLIFRIAIEDCEDGKKYRGSLWVSMNEVNDFKY